MRVEDCTNRSVIGKEVRLACDSMTVERWAVEMIRKVADVKRKLLMFVSVAITRQLQSSFTHMHILSEHL